jgi:hypothetical protein
MSDWSQMIGFDSLTRVTLLYNFPLHYCPPETLLQILIHLIGSQMHRSTESNEPHSLSCGEARGPLEPRGDT